MDINDVKYEIQTLLDLANGNTPKAYAAAQVLLATYDSANYHLCVRDLCTLDLHEYQAALTVICLRVETGVEPQELIEDYNAFPDLCKRWGDQLNIANRGNHSSSGFDYS
ncbi:DUF7673 family protein [Endozoicomonas ascidiicola]|uniref:DUF7673 family protein n=1 Tax=Endozoicomonas ascidiicola TaxID=1698521 RepID=UPI000A5AA768|nr:hypothetical protein [Endozoicomonas ascidiicola]